MQIFRWSSLLNRSNPLCTRALSAHKPPPFDKITKQQSSNRSASNQPEDWHLRLSQLWVEEDCHPYIPSDDGGGCSNKLIRNIGLKQFLNSHILNRCRSRSLRSFLPRFIKRQQFISYPLQIINNKLKEVFSNPPCLPSLIPGAN